MDLCVRLYLSGGFKFSGRTFFPEKDFTEGLKWSWMALKLMPLKEPSPLFLDELWLVGFELSVQDA